MKSYRVLLALSVFAVCTGLALADCGTCEKKATGDKASTEKCTKAECPEGADKASCKKHCEKGKECEKSKHCEKDKECDKEKHCEKAKDCDKAKHCEKAKDGKAGETCTPPVKK